MKQAAETVTETGAARPTEKRALTPQQYRQIALISLVALVLYLAMRWLPTGTNLSHMDFRIDAPNSIEFCDPANPQFIPVVAVASPVSLTIRAAETNAGSEVRATATLRTASGKPIAPEDLLVVHTKRLHLLIADPALEDYQHVHPTPGRVAGEWDFSFTPKGTGNYRVFADFTPAATERGLYAHADVQIAGSAAASERATNPAAKPRAAFDRVVERDGLRFTLRPATEPIRAKQPAGLKLTIERLDGGPVPLRPVMDAFAHLVAFDEARNGFAHLHPVQRDLAEPLDPTRPALDFRLTIPAAGRYVVWAQLNVAGRDTFVPFWFAVAD